MTMQSTPPVGPVDYTYHPDQPLSSASRIWSTQCWTRSPVTDRQRRWIRPPTRILAAVARRELFTAPITYEPAIKLTNGVIIGTNNGQTDLNGNPLSFTVVGAPSAGGKVLLDSTTGDFSFLPDLSVVNSAGTEKFNVLVSETTPLIAALSQIPLLGALVQPIVMFFTRCRSWVISLRRSSVTR